MINGTKTILNTNQSGGTYKMPRLAQPVQVTQIQHAADLFTFRKSWSELAAGVPMQTPEWLLTWLKYYTTPDDELCVLLFHETEGSLVGMAPLYIQKAWGKATIRLLGSGDVCTNHTTWLAAPGWETQIGFEVAQFLLDHNADWDCLHLEWIDDDNLAINTTIAYLEENGCLLRKSKVSNCWQIALPPTWDEYLKMLSRKHRKQCRRMQRKFFDSGLVQVHKVRNEGDLQKGFDIFLRLHAARWSDPTKPLGVFSDRTFRSFHETVARELLKERQLHLIWLEYDGAPIAAEYQFADNNTIYAYQAGMDPLFGKLRPGKLSIMASIQFAIEQGCQSLDLLRGDETYKAHYRATPSACYDILLWPDRISGRVGYTLDYTNSRLRYYARIGRYLVTHWLMNN
jgi:CelD/BcsL family acetyltransferase involved in cellulose biosynthesis